MLYWSFWLDVICNTKYIVTIHLRSCLCFYPFSKVYFFRANVQNSNQDSKLSDQLIQPRKLLYLWLIQGVELFHAYNYRIVCRTRNKAKWKYMKWYITEKSLWTLNYNSDCRQSNSLLPVSLFIFLYFLKIAFS